jgi:predicted  nucleic acid-binding Zn-ribbon protein
MRAQRADLLARVEPTVLADYASRRDHFHGVAISKVEGRRCGGCRLDLSTSEYEQLVASTPPGSVGDCPQCGRMLVP